jgi:hypothetical protein
MTLARFIAVASVFLSAQFVSAAPAKHVIIISIDGLHQADLSDPALQSSMPAILSLAERGISYANASTTFPSDSVPGALAYLTGAGPATTGVYFDDTYCRTFLPPGSEHVAQPGSEIQIGEEIDKDFTRLDGGADFGLAALDPARFPLDPSRGFAPVYPHDYCKVNTIFEIAHAAGLRTAMIDKHAAYEITAGPSGKGLDDLYAPEAHAKATIIDGKLLDSSTAPTGTKFKSVNKTTSLMIAEDQLRLAAIVNQIHGNTALGKPASVPALIAINFQALNVAQRDPNGGIDLVDGHESPSPQLLDALKNTDAAVAKIVSELKSANLWNDTLIVLTAKHGQSPRVGAGKNLSESEILSPLHQANIAIASTTVDDAELIWLANPSQAERAAALLQALASGNQNPGIAQILWGDSLQKANLVGAPDRTPGLILTLRPGSLITEKPTRAKHGGNCPDDVHVPLVLAGGAIQASLQSTTVPTTVKTAQIAVTVLKALGLDPSALQGAKIDQTAELPATGF